MCTWQQSPYRLEQHPPRAADFQHVTFKIPDQTTFTNWVRANLVSDVPVVRALLESVGAIYAFLPTDPDRTTPVSGAAGALPSAHTGRLLAEAYSSRTTPPYAWCVYLLRDLVGGAWRRSGYSRQPVARPTDLAFVWGDIWMCPMATCTCALLLISYVHPHAGSKKKEYQKNNLKEIH